MADRGEYGKAVLPLSTLFDLSDEKGKPALVYVFDADTEDEELEKSEQKAFGREDLIITTKLFRCFRIEEGTVDARSRKELVGKLPAFIVLDGSGNIVASAQGEKVSSRTLLGRMAKGFDKKSAKRAKAIVKAFRKHLVEFQAAEDAVAEVNKKIAALQERIDKNDSGSAKKQLAEAESELAERKKDFAELEKRGKEILSLEAEAVASR